MKYTTTIEIDVPPARAIELFGNPHHCSDWMESLVDMDVLQGEPGQMGTKTALWHKMGKREITMIETVTHRDIPNLFTATYEANGVWNQAIRHFQRLEDERTAWKMETEFRCSGIMWLLTTLRPGMFKRQTQATMGACKAFAENASGGPR